MKPPTLRLRLVGEIFGEGFEALHVGGSIMVGQSQQCDSKPNIVWIVLS